MKTFIYLLLVVSLSGCSLIRSPVVLVSDSLDYSEYQKNGFFITEATAVSFAYQPVASVSSLNIGGYELANQHSKGLKDDLYGTLYTQKMVKTTSKYVPPSGSLVLRELHKKALENGANGLISVKIKYFRTYGEKGSYTEWYEATGMAIKKVN